MAFSTELAANHVGFQLLDRFKPHRNISSRHRILLDSHRNYGVIMNHISRSDLKNGIPINRQLKHWRNKIIPSVGVMRIDTRITKPTDQVTVNATKLTI